MFAALYVLLFWRTQYVHPMLYFGAALKSWAFVIALVLVNRGEITRRRFIDFGVANGVVAIGFWIYLLTT